MEVAREPNRGIGTKSKLVDYPVPLGIDVPEMYRMVYSRLIPVWTLHIWAGEIEVKWRECPLRLPDGLFVGEKMTGE